ncbi:response regulator transcription factor [Chryseobacterium daeguense]|uniref:response regulator transcription factor n=1 Tax=Chryseobacterium daeguense TaxID=412438 RepID=UPI00048384AB|nr:response regulator [Chryseobacterium daeguense]
MKTIFILEDEDSIRDLLNVFFSIEGYNIIEAAAVSDFNRLYSTDRVDLFILDVRLPDGSGIDVCNILKSNPIEAPVLMMSAHAKTYEIEKKCQPDAFISKPFDLDDLLARVHSFIGPA